MPTSRSAWKAHERRTAKSLGGKRIACSGTGDIKGDVLHDQFHIECKLRAKLSIYPWYNKAKEEAKESGKMPMLVVRQKYKHLDLVVLSIEDFNKVLRCEWL